MPLPCPLVSYNSRSPIDLQPVTDYFSQYSLLYIPFSSIWTSLVQWKLHEHFNIRIYIRDVLRNTEVGPTHNNWCKPQISHTILSHHWYRTNAKTWKNNCLFSSHSLTYSFPWVNNSFAWDYSFVPMSCSLLKMR